MLYLNETRVAGTLFEDPLVFEKTVILKIGVNKPKRRNPDTGEETQPKPTKVEVKLFGDNSRNYASQFMKKGDHIMVDGRLEDNKYTDATGQDVYSQDFVGTHVQHVGPKGNS